MPKRIQRKRTEGWKMPEGAVYVGRPSRYGNPFIVGQHGTAEECVDGFRKCWQHTLKSASTFPEHPPMPFGQPIYLGPLRGKDLACWCPLDQPCHADVLLELANADAKTLTQTADTK